MRKPATAVVFALFVILFIILLAPRVVQVQKLKERSRNLEKELRQLYIQNQVLENEVRLLREDPVYLEKVAREKFNKAKEGEIVYKVIREGKNTNSPN